MASQPPVAGEPGFVPPEPETEFHISQWLELVRRRRKLIAVVAAAVVAASLVLYAITPRVFRAATVIQIERRSGTNLALGQGGVQIDDWVDAQSFYPTQYRLLQSRGMPPPHDLVPSALARNCCESPDLVGREKRRGSNKRMPPLNVLPG